MIEEGFLDVTGGRVWYRRFGSGKNAAPLLVLHGGPGSSHLPLEALDELAEERDIIYYDQLGGGYSERPEDTDLWHIDRFVEELDLVRKGLSLDVVHILGHSWGTTLLAAYLLTKPEGVKSAIFSSPCLSAAMWADDQKRLLLDMPQDIQEIINRCEAEGTTDSQEYKDASKQYYKKHLCRIDPLPEVSVKGMKLGNSEIYNLMWGPSEFCVTGNLKDFDATPRLGELSLPALYLCGKYDEATPESTGFFSTLTPRSEFHVFEKSSHTPYLEQTGEYMNIVGSFLRRTEG
ncbi:proline iminopeptidase-family hydrolase [Peribacillus sp. SCS-26]|uniref:proline iminopeptidase-family hydrolase n=1 Tax=Paraperibacillus marinus TaxID=3115295 RepID=UPI003906A890